MGFIKAFTGALSGTFADQWKDFYKPSTVSSTTAFYPAVQEGQNAGIGENTKGSNNVISNGSKIIVPTGTALITMQDGAITGCITEPGGFIWNSEDPNSRSLFAGDGVIASTLGQTWERVKFGGQPGTEQLAFYVNMQEISGNTFGTPAPISWDDAFLQTQVSASVRGTYAIQIKDPMLFVQQFLPVEYKIAGAKVFDLLESGNEKADLLFSNFTDVLPAAFGEYCNDAEGGARITQIQRDQSGIGTILAKMVEEKYQWLSKYGFTITQVSIVALEYDEQSAELVKQAQADDMELRRATRMGQAYSNNMAGMMAAASANAMNTAAGNEAGAMMGFMGMNMANMQANNLMGAATSAVQNQQPAQPVGQAQPVQQVAGAVSEPVAAQPQQDPTAKLIEMKKLLDAGAITQEDYDKVKNQVLGV